MAKLILLSIILVSMAVPIHMATGRSPRRALRRVHWTIIVYAMLWAFMCIVCYPALVPLE